MSWGTIAAALGLTLATAGAALASPTPLGAVAIVAVLAAVAGLAWLLIVVPGRAMDIVLTLAVLAMAVPVDRYFAYRDHVGGWPGVRVSLADLLLLGLMPFVAIGAMVGRVRIVLPIPVLIIYAALLAQYGLSMVLAAEPLLASFELLSAVHAIGVAVLIGAAVRGDLLRVLVTALAFQVILHTAFASAQLWTGRPVGAQWFAPVEIVPETLTTGAIRLRPVGLYDHPIVFADSLLLTIPVLIAASFIEAGRVWKTAMLLALAVGTVGLGMTLSRGAWVATAVAVVCLMVLATRCGLVKPRKVVRILVVGGLGGLLVTLPLWPRVYERLTQSEPGNFTVRLELNRIAWSMVEAHPLTGVGLNNFIPVMDRFDPTNVMRRFPATVHNLYLLEAAEAGIPALLLMVLLFCAILTLGYRRLRDATEPSRRWIAAAILAALAGFLVSQLADFSHRLEPLRSMIWMLVGILFGLLPEAGAEGQRRA